MKWHDIDNFPSFSFIVKISQSLCELQPELPEFAGNLPSFSCTNIHVYNVFTIYLQFSPCNHLATLTPFYEISNITIFKSLLCLRWQDWKWENQVLNSDSKFKTPLIWLPSLCFLISLDACQLPNWIILPWCLADTLPRLLQSGVLGFEFQLCCFFTGMNLDTLFNLQKLQFFLIYKIVAIIVPTS